MYLVLLYGPGIVLGTLLGLRGLVTVAVAPAVTYGVVGAATPLLGKLDIRWNLGTAAVVFAITVVLSWLVGRFVRPLLDRWTGRGEVPDEATDEVPADEAHRTRKILAVLVGLGFAAVIGVVEVLRGMGSEGIDSVHQGWDPAWHANYTQWITDTGDASPLRAGDFQNWSSHAPTYYPSAIHALGSLVQQVTGQNAVRLINMDMLLITAVLVPISVAALTWYVSRRNALATSLAAAFSASFSIFPIDQIWRPALPFAIGLALLGPVLVVLLTGVTRHRGLIPVAALALVGIASVHTSVAFCVAFFCFWWFVVRALKPRRELVGEFLALAALGALAAVALAPQVKGILSQAGRVATFDWSQGVSTIEASRQVFGFGFGDDQLAKFGFHTAQTTQYLLAVVVTLSALVALRHRRTAWLTVTYLFFALLSVHASVPHWKIIGLLSAPWYNDPWRTAAIACVAATPLVGIGLASLGGLLRLPGTARPYVAIGVSLVIFFASGFGYVDQNAKRVERGYRPGVLDAHEVEAMRELPRVTGGKGRVLNDPYDGSVWMYAISKQPSVFTHYDVGVLSDDQWYMVNMLNQWDTNPAVRAAAKRLGVRYLYLATDEIYGSLARPKGYLGIEKVPGVKVVLDTGTAKVYQLPDLG
ncbi:hypothetical protein F0L68_25415 [Solihabitans fulvus]|uniref:Uncharacterized protein n=1 Tax=Solihabitans fulvus TaxID=1892852 RepID=A0A5B2X1K1_9PSEU|nr:DUF6541 family protein [Solihabitans fulvus]KAA2257086.1 hypothetical protein F0L68_25415 [Solihabitans fulvus]